MEGSDGGERTKKERIGDSLVMGEKAKGRLKSYSTTSCQSHTTTVESQEGGRMEEGGKVAYDFDPD